jgi:site-specific recombinase XerC
MQRFCRYLATEYRLEKLANIAPKHIHAYTEHMKARGLSASTIKTDLAALRFWHDQIPNPRYELPSNDTLNLNRREFGKIGKAWPDEVFNRMLMICVAQHREDYAALMCLARYAGLRIHECFRIDTSTAEVAIRNMAITIKGKGGKTRTVPIQYSIRAGLETQLSRTPRGHKLFVSEGVTTDVAIKQLQRFITNNRDEAQCGELPQSLTFHGLRHLYAQENYMEFIATGYTPVEARRAVSKLLGHERDDVTRIYLAGLREDNANV